MKNRSDLLPCMKVKVNEVYTLCAGDGERQRSEQPGRPQHQLQRGGDAAAVQFWVPVPGTQLSPRHRTQHLPQRQQHHCLASRGRVLKRLRLHERTSEKRRADSDTGACHRGYVHWKPSFRTNQL